MDVQAQAQHAGRSQTARRIVLVGWGAKGVVYLALAYLVLQMAFGSAEQEASTAGALSKIAQGTPGAITLIVVGVGLLAFAVGRGLEVTTLAQPQIDAKDKAVAAFLALVYTSLSLTAFSIVGFAAGSAGSGGSSTEQQSSNLLFGLPGGRVLVGLLGIAVVAAGAHAAYKGVKQQFLPTLRTHDMPASFRSIVAPLGTAAYITKGAIVAVIGFFFVQAAVTYDPGRARGLDAALGEVAQQPGGQIALVLTAVGLLAYAVFAFVEARYRDVGSSASGTA